jgi:hypothetical protein
MAQVAGFEDVAIYAFFRDFLTRTPPTNYMKQVTLERWTDRVLLPAIYSQTSSSTVQHYPANYQSGRLARKVKNVKSHAALDKFGS